MIFVRRAAETWGARAGTRNVPGAVLDEKKNSASPAKVSTGTAGRMRADPLPRCSHRISPALPPLFTLSFPVFRPWKRTCTMSGQAHLAEATADALGGAALAVGFVIAAGASP